MSSRCIRTCLPELANVFSISNLMLIIFGLFQELAKKDDGNPEKSDDETEKKKGNKEEEEEIEAEEYDEEDIEEVGLQMMT